MIRIVDNEWRTPIENWDVEVIGPRIKVRSAPEALELRLRTEPPRTLVVEKLDMYYQGAHITCDESDGFVAQTPDLLTLRAVEMEVLNAKVAIEVTRDDIVIGRGGGISIGSRGVHGSFEGPSKRPLLSLPRRSENKTLQKHIKGSDRNKLCPCGSGKKSKKCHHT